MIFPYKNKRPAIHASSFVAPGSHILGDVRVGEHSSVWFGAVLRGDIHRIRIGKYSNIQDNAVVHVDSDKPCVIGSYVTIGHQATIHACRIGDGTLVGIGARVLSGAVIGKGCLIGAGAVVLEGQKVPDHSLVMGLPAKVRRTLTASEIRGLLQHAKKYWYTALEYKKKLG